MPVAATRTEAPSSANPTLQAKLERLAALDLAGLRKAWRRVFRRAAPDGLLKALLHRAIAHRLQEDALGGLDRATLRALARMMGEGGTVIPLPNKRGTKPGAVLVREWQGAMQTVMILADGFAWNGRTFGSLSEVAHAITGTRWNGPRFFGLRAGSKANDPTPSRECRDGDRRGAAVALIESLRDVTGMNYQRIRLLLRLWDTLSDLAELSPQIRTRTLVRIALPAAGLRPRRSIEGV